MAIRPQDRPRRKIPMFRITCFPRSNMGRNSYCHVELRYIYYNIGLSSHGQMTTRWAKEKDTHVQGHMISKVKYG